MWLSIVGFYLYIIMTIIANIIQHKINTNATWNYFHKICVVVSVIAFTGLICSSFGYIFSLVASQFTNVNNYVYHSDFNFADPSQVYAVNFPPGKPDHNIIYVYIKFIIVALIFNILLFVQLVIGFPIANLPAIFLNKDGRQLCYLFGYFKMICDNFDDIDEYYMTITAFFASMLY